MKTKEVKGSIDDPIFLDPAFPIPIFRNLDSASQATIVEEATLFRQAAIFLYLLSLTKAPQYKDSWCKRGMAGIFLTIARKWDRLEQAWKHDPALLNAPGEHIEETIKDAAVYFVKWVGWFRHTHPEIWHSMVADMKCAMNNLQANGTITLLLPVLEDDESDSPEAC